MAVMQSSSSSADNPQLEAHGKPLLQLARQSIEHGLICGKPVPVTLGDYHCDLQQPGAAFVTLHKQQQLRGCIGNLNAQQPLVVDVANNAFNAAFKDPRFPAVEGDELAQLLVEISVLTPYEPVIVGSETELLNR